MKIFQIWPLLTNRAVNENALQVFDVYWWYLIIDCKLLILTVLWFMLSSIYFANCTPLSMKWIISHKGKDFKGGNWGAQGESICRGFCCLYTSTESSTQQLVCRAAGWISHGKQHLKLRRERGVTGTLCMNGAVFVSKVAFYLSPLILSGQNLTWLELQWATFP